MINPDDLKKVAKLARLSLKPQELETYQSQFSAILDYFEQIASIDTKGLEPLITPTDFSQHLRTDENIPGEGAEAALANAPERSGNLFRVPPVV
jgi:aspartyl-tRNA(Asn)/glutamyl-tRNA(Gln) amidotransferase subunit C